MGDRFDRHRPPATRRIHRGGWVRTEDWLDEAVATAVLGGAGGPLLVVGGAGDAAIALLAAGAEAVLAVGADAGAAALIELKAASAALHPLEARQLVGLDPAGRRVFLYHRVRAALSDAARAWWDAREDVIRAGVADAGDYERSLARFRRLVLPAAVDGDTLRRYFAGDAIVAPAWLGRRLRAALATLLPTPWPTDPVAGVTRSAAAAPPRENGPLQRLLLGGYVGDAALPSWLTRRIEAPDRRLRVEVADPLAAIAAGPAGAFAGAWLGALDDRDGPRLLAAAARAVAPGGPVVWWGPAPGPDVGLVAADPAIRDRGPVAPPLRLARVRP